MGKRLHFLCEKKNIKQLVLTFKLYQRKNHIFQKVPLSLHFEDQVITTISKMSREKRNNQKVTRSFTRKLTMETKTHPPYTGVEIVLNEVLPQEISLELYTVEKLETR